MLNGQSEFFSDFGFFNLKRVSWYDVVINKYLSVILCHNHYTNNNRPFHDPVTFSRINPRDK